MCEFEKSANEQIGKKLREIRVISGMSQGALGEIIGVSFQQIQKYETGRNRLSVSKLSKIAKELEVPVTKFFEEVEYLAEGKDRRKIRMLMNECNQMSDKHLSALLGVATSINQNAA